MMMMQRYLAVFFFCSITKIGNAFTSSAIRMNSVDVDRLSFMQSSVSTTLFLSNSGAFQKQPIKTKPGTIMSSSTSSSSDTSNPSMNKGVLKQVAYRSLSVTVDDQTIPFAFWYPTNSSPQENQSDIYYKHSISLQKIGKLLANWNLPSFLRKNYDMGPTGKDFVIDGTNIPIPKDAPVVLLAHGYLGSRFDLSHIAEALSQQGFICVSTEYPESLAASYEKVDGLDRSKITAKVQEYLTEDLELSLKKKAILGHSLGCGTVTQTGDKNMVRVFLAGPPNEREDTVGGDILFISSVNDGAVTMDRLRSSIPSDLERLTEGGEFNVHNIPRRSAYVFEKLDAPNHISFLAEGPNNAMIDFLSPLLPVAQALSIPVLDFDKYKISQDSGKTAQVVIPLVVSYLKKCMDV